MGYAAMGMRYGVASLMAVCAAAGLAAAATKPAATKPVDYYGVTAETFWKLPEVNRKLPAEEKGGLDVKLLNAAVFHATNEERVKNKLPAFKHLPQLEKAATGHSDEMVKLGFFSHESPTPANKTPFDRIKATGLRYRSAGENIAVRSVLNAVKGNITIITRNGQVTRTDSDTGKPVDVATYAELARMVVDQWMNSPTHRDNILAKFTHLGAGAARGKSDGMDSVYFTQNFATP